MNVFYKQVFNSLLVLVLAINLTGHAQTRIKDIRPGASSSSPEQLTSINGTLYFVADDGIHGKELWKSDGTEQGTMLVKDITPGVEDGQVQHLTNVNGTLFFSAKIISAFGPANELYKSDGTADGTVELLDGQGNKAESKNPDNLTNLGGILYYTNTLSLGGNGYTNLLKSNGTNAPGTGRIYYLASEPPNFFKISQLTGLNGVLYFTYGGALWQSDGSAMGTIKVKSIAPGPGNTEIQNIINVNNTLFFTADDGQSSGVRRLWKSDGTANGTVKLKDGIGNPAEAPNPTNLTNVNGTLYYTSSIAKGGYGYWGLFKSDGTDSPGTGFVGTFIKSTADTPLVGTDIPYEATANQASSPSSLIDVGGTLYFVFAGNLWKSNGTPAGTIKVANAVNPSLLTNVNGTLYFLSGPGSIYKTDPSANSAAAVFTSSDPTYNLTNVNGTLFFTHSDPASTGVELYKLDSASPPSDFSITGVTAVNCSVLTAGLHSLTFNPTYSGINGQPVSFSVVNELSPTLNSGPYTLNLYTDNPVITLKATQIGTAAEASYVYNWLAACESNPPPSADFAITGVTSVNCATVSAGLRSLTFTPTYAGTNGQPVSFSVVNELSPTLNSGPYTLNLYTDNPVITLKATQTGMATEASYAYNWLAACGQGARIGVESTATLQVKLLGNPVHTAVEVEVTSAEGASLNLSLTDMQGNLIGQSRTEQAHLTERYHFSVSDLSAGVLLLRVSTNRETKTVRIVKVN
jgi:ELWxxDGT repeat protein